MTTETTKRRRVGGLVLAAIGLVVVVGIVISRPAVRRYTGILGQVDQALTLLERLDRMVGVNTDLLNALPEEWERIQETQIKEYEAEILHWQKIAEKEKKEAEQWRKKAQEAQAQVPPASDVIPVDLEECNEELISARLRADLLEDITIYQRGEINALDAVRISQEGIIQSQADIIKTQGEHIAKIHESLKGIEKEAQGVAFIGILTGTTAGVLCVVVSVPVGVGVAVVGIAYLVIKK